MGTAVGRWALGVIYGQSTERDLGAVDDKVSFSRTDVAQSGDASAFIKNVDGAKGWRCRKLAPEEPVAEHESARIVRESGAVSGRADGREQPV